MLREIKKRPRQPRLAGEKRPRRERLVCFTQAYGQDPRQLAVEFGMRRGEFLKTLFANEAVTAVTQYDDRSRPWQPVDHGEFTGELSRAEQTDNALLAALGLHHHFEQTCFDKVEPIAGFAGSKQHAACFGLASHASLDQTGSQPFRQ